MVKQPLLSVWLEAAAKVQAVVAKSQDLRRSCRAPASAPQACVQLEGGLLQVSPHQPAVGLPRDHAQQGGRGARRATVPLGVSREAPAHPTSS